VQIYVPFAVVGDVCESLFDCELKHCELLPFIGERDERLCGPARMIQAGLSSMAPTNLILDSWALILADVLVQRFSSHSQRRVRTSFGKLPVRGVARVVDYIEASIDCDLDLGSLANIAAMSTYHFARRFKETVGMSPHAYVLMRRVRRATHVLEQKTLGLAQIAAACGFSSQAHFTTAFRKQVGVTPSAYRRVHQS
jgi:AraC family transcriptional regulator